MRLSAVISRRAAWPLIIGCAAGLLTLMAPGSTETAIANGDTRTIYLYHAHTHESIAATFKVNGQYDQTVLAQLNHFLRDWRNNDEINMDPHLFDVVWEVYRQSGSQQPIEVLSAYRSPQTNAMLRRRTRGVAEHSQHILGHAMDQHYMDVPMSRIRDLGMRLQRGGVGFYPTSGTPFVHLDVGGIRHWPRMSYEQLARLFPDGKTVHIPSNGVPLPGYEEARAELAARGDDSIPSATEVKSKSFFAWLFGGGGDEQEDNSEAGVRTPAPGRQIASSGNAAPADNYGKQDRADLVTAAVPAQPAPQIQPASRPIVAAAPSAQILSEGQLAVPAHALSGAPNDEAPSAPLPPRRPVELASTGPDAPLPPARPTAFPHDAMVQAGPADAIGAVLTGSTLADGAGAHLPAVIMQGSDRSAKRGAMALAYAPTPETRQAAASPLVQMATTEDSASRAASTVPLPVARPPELVSGHLDRSNFRSLTRPVLSEASLSRSALGAAVPPVRAAMRSTFDAFVPLPQARPASFGTGAPALPTRRFILGRAASTTQSRTTDLD